MSHRPCDRVFLLRRLGIKRPDGALQGLHRGYCLLNKGIVNFLVHVDALDRAAALAGVVHRAVGQGRRRRQRIGIVAHIGWVFAAQLQLQFDKLAAYRLRNTLASLPGGGNVDALLEAVLDVTRVND